MVTLTINISEHLAEVLPDVAAIKLKEGDRPVGLKERATGEALHRHAKEAACHVRAGFSPEVKETVAATLICDEVADAIFEIVVKALLEKAVDRADCI